MSSDNVDDGEREYQDWRRLQWRGIGDMTLAYLVIIAVLYFAGISAEIQTAIIFLAIGYAFTTKRLRPVSELWNEGGFDGIATKMLVLGAVALFFWSVLNNHRGCNNDRGIDGRFYTTRVCNDR